MQRALGRGRRGPSGGFKLSLRSSLNTYCPAPPCNPTLKTSSPPAQKSQSSDRTQTQRMALRIDAHLFCPSQGMDHLQVVTNVSYSPTVRGSFSSKMQQSTGRKKEVQLTDEYFCDVPVVGRNAVFESVVKSLKDPNAGISQATESARLGMVPGPESSSVTASESVCRGAAGPATSLSSSDHPIDHSSKEPLDSLPLHTPNTATLTLCGDTHPKASVSQECSPVPNVDTAVSLSGEVSVSNSSENTNVCDGAQPSLAGEGGATYWSKHRVNLLSGKEKGGFDFSPASLNRGAGRLLWKKLECAASRRIQSMDEPQTSASALGQTVAIPTTGGQTLVAVWKGEAGTADGTSESEEKSGEGGVLDRVEKLRQVIADYAYRYHTLDSPVISDAAYDALVRELKDLESQLPPEATAESMTARVGAPPSQSMAKVRHAVPMLSLAAVNKEEELKVWHERLQQRLSQASKGGQQEQPLREAWVVEPKVDGLALSLRYEGGKLVCAATRGDGYQGEDVTHNARHVSGIPETLGEDGSATGTQVPVVEVRGEVYMTLQDFQELNAAKVKTGEKPFANPRNAAAGSMRLLQTRDAEQRRLSFMAYSIAPLKDSNALGVETSLESVRTQWDALDLLKQLGFSVNDDNRRFDSFDAAQHYSTRWRDSRPSLKYESDGVVFKVDDLAVQAALGAVGSDPRWAVAWKFAATEAVTVLEGIDLSIGRSGSIIPTARLKPVELGGVTISRASLHNFGLVEKMGICEGDHVVVQRAGDVIPQVVQVLKALRPEHAHLWLPPERCPSCDEKLTTTKDKHITSCCNAKCPGRHSRQIEHYAKTLIRGLGPSIVTQIQDEGLVADPADFYALKAETLSKLDGFGKKSAAKLVKAIEESKGKPLWELIAALGIPSVGGGAAKLLAEWFGSLDRLILATEEELLLVPGVGKISAAAIKDWCTNPFNVQLVKRIEGAGFSPTVNDPEITKLAQVGASAPPALEPEKLAKKRASKAGTNNSTEEREAQNISNNSTEEREAQNISPSTDGLGSEAAARLCLQGKSVVVTGEFEDLSREEMEQLVLSHGGQVRKSVSSKTTFIVAGRFPGPSKMAKASQLRIPVHDLSTFHELLGRTAAPSSNDDVQPVAVPAFEHAVSSG